MSEPSQNVDVLIVTVNYKTPNLATDLMTSLAPELKEQRFHLVVVDNASGDNSASIVSQFINKKNYHWASFIQSDNNLGYAGGNNFAIEYANQKKIKYKYIWFLNPDTRIYNNAGVELQHFIEEHKVHAVGSRLEDSDGTLQCSHFNFPGVRSELSAGLRLHLVDKFLANKIVRRSKSDIPIESNWLAGASMMVTKHYFELVGMMDSEYFLYFEELDFCLQGHRLGMRCWYVPQSRVYHAVGASTGISDHRKKVPRRPKYWFDSRRRYYLKNYGASKLAFCDIAFMLGYSAWVLRKLFTDKQALNNEPACFLKDFYKHSFLCRGFKY